MQLSSDEESSKILHSPRVRTKSLASGESKILHWPSSMTSENQSLGDDKLSSNGLLRLGTESSSCDDISKGSQSPIMRTLSSMLGDGVNSCKES